MNGVFIALGANLGKPAETFARALQDIQGSVGKVLRCSSLWHSPAWPDPSAPAYVNGVIEIDTELDPLTVLSKLHDIEAKHGRLRRGTNSPRTLDLDLISYGKQIATTPDIALPHPRVHLRGFVLLPLQEIAPGFRHPATGETITTMLSRLPSEDILEHRRLGTMLAFQSESP